MARPIKVLTKAKRRSVLRAVARKFEKNPGLYQFMVGRIPKSGESGCMLAFAAAILRLRPNAFGEALDRTAIKLGFAGDSDFYRAMKVALRELGVSDNIMNNDGLRMARGLRQLAVSI